MASLTDQAPAPAPAAAPSLAQVPLPAEPAADQPVAPEDDALSSKTSEPDPEWTPTENPNTTVVPGEMRSDREEIPAGATKEMADKAETMEARQRMSRAAVGCQTYWPFPYEVCGVIRDKYNSLGGPASFLSYPNSPEYTNPDGFGKRTQFLNGPIYWSSATGAHPVVNSFLNRWGIHQYEAGRLKYPTTDEIVLPDGGRRQEFQQGAIYVAFQNAIGSAIFNGPLRDKYNALGGLAPANTLLGYPTQDQFGLPDGQGQSDRFQNGVIYWSPATGAHEVYGDILSKWAGQGYEKSPVGYPTASAVGDGGFRLTQNFQRGQLRGYLEPVLSLSRIVGLTPAQTDQTYDALKLDFEQRSIALADGFNGSLGSAQESQNFTVNAADAANTESGCGNLSNFVKPGNERTNRGDLFYSVAVRARVINHGHNGIFVSSSSSNPDNIVTVEAVGAEEGVDRLLGRDRLGVCKPRYLSVDTDNSTRDQAAAWAETKVGKGYESNFALTRIGNLDRDSYNCSSLVWAAFKSVSGGGLDIGEAYPYEPYNAGVYPLDILESHNTTEFS